MSIHSILPLLSSLIFLIIGTNIFLVNKGCERNAFLRFCYFTFHWQFSWFILFSLKNEPAAILVARIGYSGIIFLPAAFYESVSSFYKVKTTATKFFYFTCSLFLLPLWLSDYFISGCHKYYFGFYPEAGFLHLWYLLIVIFSLYSVIIEYVNKIKSEKDKSKKTQIIIFYSGLMIYAIAAIDYLLNYPELLNSLKIQLYPLGVFFIIISTILFLYVNKIRITQALEMQIEERTKELKKSLEALKLAEESKNEFIANITHDLKTPLSIISGHTDSLRASFDEDSTESKYLNYIGNSITQINHLLDMLISMALLDKKHEKPNLELYDYPLLVQNFCSHFIVKGEQHGISFKIESLSEKIVVSIDTIWIERVLGNLIQNSFKFTSKGGTIKVRLSRDDEYIYTEVIDTGVGIPSEKLTRIFEREYQAHEDKKHLGYGLGLSISKEMVKRLGGSIDAFSKVGEGTTLRFSLPIHCDQFASVKNVPIPQVERRSGVDRRLENRIKFVQDKIEQDAQIEKIKINIEQFENKSTSLPTILICEDNHGQLHLLIEGLKNNFNLIIAETGIEGLQKLDIYSSRINCIISDVRMPEMDGFEFCQRVFEQKRFHNIPFIFLTSYTNDHDQLRGLSYGATDYLQKPFNRSILIEKLNYWLSRREHEQILENIVTTLENKNEEICKLRSIISHEIRNPLMILNFVHYNFSKLKTIYFEENNEKAKKYWGSLDAIHMAMETINGVLNSAKIIESGITATSLKRESVSTLINDALHETEHLCTSVKIQINNPFSDEYVLCDRQLINQVFVNLIRNACEAIAEVKREDGLIELKLSKKDACFHFSISDNGPGIPEITQKNLFQYNYTTKKDGTGIGLYFSKRILKVHGGDILLESQVGKGTTFTIVIQQEKHSEKLPVTSTT